MIYAHHVPQVDAAEKLSKALAGAAMLPPHHAPEGVGDKLVAEGPRRRFPH
jgi:hypothetical protein